MTIYLVGGKTANWAAPTKSPKIQANAETAKVSKKMSHFNTPYGFNFQWIVSHQPGRAPEAPDRKALEFMAEHGFNFVRIPCDYRYWTEDFDYFNPNESVFEHIDGYLAACKEFGLHMSLNIHRAPGYCINSNELEKHNLWVDKVAQDAFVFNWETFARRYKSVGEELSFDLLNEPPDLGQYGMTRDIHEALMRRTSAAILAIDPSRALVIDGLAGGNLAMPELADLDLVQSCRGYQPMTVSHYTAEWWSGSKGMPLPQYPGSLWEGKVWNRDALVEFYQPWVAIQKTGHQVYVGEFGCYKRTPQDVALRWFTDLFSVFRELGFGYAMWNFVGGFGIIDHNRPGAVLEEYKGYRVDRALLDLMLTSQV
jgi:aryl-phospho-beta-D-glucosidase BglC (GH1 family)